MHPECQRQARDIFWAWIVLGLQPPRQIIKILSGPRAGDNEKRGPEKCLPPSRLLRFFLHVKVLRGRLEARLRSSPRRPCRSTVADDQRRARAQGCSGAPLLWRRPVKFVWALRVWNVRTGGISVLGSIYGRCTGLLPQPTGNVADKDLHESASAAHGVRLSNPMTVLLFIAPDSE